jgi:hypothetical protein
VCPSSKIEHKIQDEEISFDGQIGSESLWISGNVAGMALKPSIPKAGVDLHSCYGNPNNAGQKAPLP